MIASTMSRGGSKIWERGVDLEFLKEEGGTAKATTANTKVYNIHNTVISRNHFN